MKKRSTSSGARRLTQRVKTARQRKPSSTRWLQRQLNDPYVHRAKREGYRARSAFKLIELDDRFHFLKAGKTVLDLGAAPGGWTQVAAARVKSPPENPAVLAVDLLAMDTLPGAQVLRLDFMQDSAPETIRAALHGVGVDIVLSDMAPNTTGHAATDHLRIIAIVDAAYAFAREVLNPGGVFVAKLFQGGAESALLSQMKKDFAQVKHAKPKASRADSSEVYVVAMGYRGKQ